MCRAGNNTAPSKGTGKIARRENCDGWMQHLKAKWMGLDVSADSEGAEGGEESDGSEE